MKLYDFKAAPSPRRVRIFAAEKGMDLPVVPVNLADGEQKSAEFRRINPDCTVPVLELDDGTHLSEVNAICDYLESMQPAPPMIGEDARTRAQVLMWSGIIEQQGLSALADLFRNSIASFAGRAVQGPHRFEQIPELAERGRRRAEILFDRVDARLDGREFIVHDRVSMADITCLVSVDFARWSKLDLLGRRPRLARWHKAMSSRPSAGA